MGDRKTATEFYNQAVSAANDRSNSVNITTAYQLFSSAAYADPTWWNSFYQCGNNNSDLKFYEASIACWRRALECELTEDEKGKVYANISQHLHTIGRVSESLPYAEESCRIAPLEGNRWINLSVIYRTAGDLPKMLDAAERAIRLQPDDPTAQMAYSFALLFDGQLAKGLAEFECRYRYALHSFTQYPYPRWQGERDCTLFLVADQGLGDTLCYARFIPEVARRCRFVHVAAHGELMRAFQHAFAAYDNVDVIPLHPHFRQADYWTTFVSLPFALKLTDDEIASTPSITLPVIAPAPPSQWKVSDRKLHVGIAWAGSPLNLIDAHRSIPLTQFLELYRCPGIQLYSLQVGENARDMHQKGASPIVKETAIYIRDVVDTVGLLQNLDLVICCESALGHICAAVGTECWIPLSFLGHDYRAGRLGEKKLWTPNHRFFLQNEGETWQPVFERIVEALRERVVR